MNKVVFIIKNIQGNGAEKFVITLASAMNEHHGIECHIICFEGFIEYRIPPEIKLHIFELNNSLSYKENCALLDDYILNSLDEPNLILSNLTFSDKILRYSKLKNVYHVIHSHTSSEHYKHKKAFSKWLAKIKLKALYAVKPAIFVSRGVASDFIENINKKSTPNIIYNPIDSVGIKMLATINHDKKLPKKYILHVGKFNEAKRQDRLLRAYALAKPEHELILIGKGHTISVCQKLADDLGISKKVHFLGHIKNPYPIMAQASLLVLTSDFEGLSYVLLESISLNVPTISVDCPSGPKEVFGYKYAHCLTDLSDESIALKIMSALFEPKKYTPELNAIFGMKEAASAYLRLCDKSNHSKAGSSTAVDQSKDKISSMIKR